MKYGALIIAVVLTLGTVLCLESLSHPLPPEQSGVVFVVWLGVVKGIAVVLSAGARNAKCLKKAGRKRDIATARLPGNSRSIISSHQNGIQVRYLLSSHASLDRSSTNQVAVFPSAFVARARGRVAEAA
jgi:hypothetical protein